MNRKLKKKLFQEYEAEMNFKMNVEEVKSHLQFNEPNTVQHVFKNKMWSILIPAFSLSVACIGVVVSTSVINNGSYKSNNYEEATAPAKDSLSPENSSSLETSDAPITPKLDFRTK